jgi:acetyl esterase/lipase
MRRPKAAADPEVLTQTPPQAPYRLAYGSQQVQFGDLWLPPGDELHPVVIFIHGGFWRNRYSLDHAGFLCQALAEAGIAVWSLEYRRLGDAGGGWPGTFQDVAHGVAFVRRLADDYPLDLGRAVLMGHSAGGHLALWAAAAARLPPDHVLRGPPPPDLRAVIALAAVPDLRQAWTLGLGQGVVEDLLGGRPDQVPERYGAASPGELLPLGVSQKLIHGTDDEVVPLEHSQRHAAAARSAGDDISESWLEGVGHFEPISPWTAAWQVVHSAVVHSVFEK